MKKIISSFLVLIMLCLCLFGCSKPENNSPENPDEQTEAAFFQLKTLPDIGEYTSGDTAKYYFDDGAHKEFEPSSDYGKIVPYIKSTRLFESADSYSFIDEETGETVTIEQDFEEKRLVCDFGLATADGRIICEPFFNSFFLEKGVGGKDYLLLMNDNDEANYYVVAADGSWMKEVEDYPSKLSDEFFTPSNGFYALSRTDNSVSIFNLDGEQVFKTKNPDEKYYFSNAYYCNDEYFVFSISYVTDEITCERFDKSGNRLESFKCGKGYVSDCLNGVFIIYDLNSSDIRLIDSSGKTIKTITDSSGIAIDRSHNCLLVFDGERVQRIGFNGESLGSFTVDIESIYDYQEMLNGSAFIGADKKTIYSPTDGSEIVLDLNGKSVKTVNFEFSEDDNLYIIAIDNEGYAHIFEPNGEKLVYLKKPIFEASNYCNISISNTCVVYPTADGDIIIHNLKSGNEVAVEGEKFNDNLSIFMRGEKYISRYNYDAEIPSETVISIETGKPVFKKAGKIEAFESYYVIGTTDCSLVLDSNENTIMKLMNNVMY